MQKLFLAVMAAHTLTLGSATFTSSQRRHLGGLGGPSPPQGKRKKEKKKEKKKKEKKREKKRKRKKRTTMNDVKLLHIKCCFFQFFNSPVA